MSTDAERAVIGAALLAPDSIRFATDHISGDDFADRRLGAAFTAIHHRHTNGEPIDEITIAADLASGRYRLTNLELFDCRHATPAASTMSHYARIVADHAGKRRLEIFAIRAQQAARAGGSYSDIMEAVRREWSDLQQAAARTTDAYVPTLGELLDGPTDYEWVVPNLLEKQDRLVITGGEGAGKSYFVQQLAILSAAGIHPTTFAPITPVPVLVVDAENSNKQWRRRVGPFTAKAARVGSADPRMTMRIKTLPRMNILDEKDLGLVHRWIDEHAPDLLVIGPFYKLTPKAINSDDDAAPLIAALDGIRARGCAIVMEAHAGKALGSDGERSLAPRGASALMGWPEFGFGLRLVHDPHGPSVEADLVRWRGDRDQRAWPHKIRRGGIWPWTDADPDTTSWTYSQQSQQRYA